VSGDTASTRREPSPPAPTRYTPGGVGAGVVYLVEDDQGVLTWVCGVGEEHLGLREQ
jgi:hypothetical protein